MEVQVVVVTDSRVLNNKTGWRRTRTVADGCVEWNANDTDIELLIWVRQASHMRKMGKGADAGEAELMWCQYGPLGLSEKKLTSVPHFASRSSSSSCVHVRELVSWDEAKGRMDVRRGMMRRGLMVGGLRVERCALAQSSRRFEFC